jgi:hypothetical protein
MREFFILSKRQENKVMKKTLKLTFITEDGWSRPVYRGDDRRIYVDTDPRKNVIPNICTKLNNDIDGEPDCPINEDIEIIYIPHRITW